MVAAWAITTYDLPPSWWQLVLLAALATAGDAAVVRLGSTIYPTPLDAVAQVAGLFLGPPAAVMVGVGATSASYGRHHAELRAGRDAGPYAFAAFAINAFSLAVPACLAAALVRALGLGPHTTDLGFVAGAALLPVTAAALSCVAFAALTAIRSGRGLAAELRDVLTIWPTLIAQIGFVFAIAVLWREAAVAGLAVAAIAVAAYLYMARLLVLARSQTAAAEAQREVADERARQMTAMSWGVLSALVQTLNERNPAAARHSAAVAAFSRDVARQMGLGQRDQDLVHVAGLLHDIGKFALADVVLDASRPLAHGPEWDLIDEHPRIGARLLADLASYGPVAEIVLQHHERVDGEGYPQGLHGDEINALAKIVACAEVYDTITAHDTYRTPLGGLEAIRELRRVAGTQLDGDVVEAMIAALAGRDSSYRSAQAADFAAELELQRQLYLETAATVGEPSPQPI